MKNMLSLRMPKKRRNEFRLGTDLRQDRSDEPVSYTHLDVYKRQGLSSAETDGEGAAEQPAMKSSAQSTVNNFFIKWLFPFQNKKQKQFFSFLQFSSGTLHALRIERQDDGF